MISISALFTTVVYLIVAGLILSLLWWLIGYTAPPEPFAKVAKVLLALLAVLVCATALLSVVSGQPVFRP